MSGKTAAVIPARYASTRFPGKMLADLNGRPLIQWVYEKAAASKADLVLVAADDRRVIEAVEKFGGKAVMTDPQLPSGTDRVYEALKDSDVENVINVQGDEPMMPSKVIDELIDCLNENPGIEMATVAVPAEREEVENNPNIVKVVLNSDNEALYFSRAPIPYLREGGDEAQVLRHWGIYAYRMKVLERFVSLPVGRLENCEKLEQLRAIENGIKIKVLISDCRSIGVDTPEDLETVKRLLNKSGASRQDA